MVRAQRRARHITYANKLGICLLFAGHTSAVTGVAFSPDGKLVLTGSSDGTARLWDRESAHELARVRLPGLTDWVRSVAISPDGLLAPDFCWNLKIKSV
jgi:WD40 repeat protein